LFAVEAVTLPSFGGVVDAVEFDLLRFDGTTSPEAIAILCRQPCGGESTEVRAGGGPVDSDTTS
jgi:hypothetical protein